MTWKIFSAYLKGLSKYRKMAFFFLKYLFSFQRYWRFSMMQIRSVMTSYCLRLKIVKYWINDISGNIEAVFLTLGTINLHKNDTLNAVAMATVWCCLKKTKIPSFFLNQEPSNLHNRKTSISLKRKKIFQKEKRYSSVFWNAFQISRKYFSCHMHFKLA